MPCSVIRNKQTGEIQQVIASNGKPSILFQSLSNVSDFVNDKETALRYWAKAYTPTFKEDFGNWELLSDASQLSNTIPSTFWRNLFIQDPERFLFEMAQQLNGNPGEVSGAKNTMGPQLAEIALKLFPESRMGDEYISRFQGKVDENHEPLSNYIFSQKEDDDKVSYGLKSVAALSSRKAIDLFNSLKNNNVSDEIFWKKLQSDLMIPKQQLELLKAFNTKDREQLIIKTLADYSYTIRIDKGRVLVDKQVRYHPAENQILEEDVNTSYDRAVLQSDGRYKIILVGSDGEEFSPGIFTKERALEEFGDYIFSNKNSLPASRYYERLTVPGGANYTENEISIPEIIPNIKGHARFSTDNGIGWFRSDETAKTIHNDSTEVVDPETGDVYGGGSYNISDGTDTRRILEIQSDLFQKGREKDLLTGKETDYTDTVLAAQKEGEHIWDTRERLKIENDKKNAFLQLLNKDNNWVTFFVRSIIQDSAKKGYEKVLFPSGNTANKVEGQETAQEFLRIKYARLRSIEYLIEQKKERILDLRRVKPSGYLTSIDAYEKEIYNIETNEKKSLLAEIKNVEEGNDSFSKINAFYETAIFNILKKQGYNPKQITDEYGNTWNEVTIDPSYSKHTILFNRSENPVKQLSEENQKIVKDLMGKGLITKRMWNGMYFIPKTRFESTTGSAFKDYRDGYWATDKAKFERLRAEIERRQLGWLELRESKSGNSIQVKISPDRQEASKTRLYEAAGKEAFTAIADRLSKRLGVAYKIIDTEEAMQITSDSKIPWNGEGAFTYKGMVYVLEGATNLENGIHEFAHFFVRAVSKESPYLIEKLYRQFAADPTLKSRYIDFVDNMYQEFSDADKMEEVMVRAITDKALDLVDPETGNVIIEAIRKIFATLKNLLRTLFGVSVKNLSEKTTLDQLAAILLGDREGEVIDLADTKSSFFQGLFPLFNREMANELEKLSSSAVKTSIDTFFTVVKEHLDRLREDRDLVRLREVLANEKDSTLVKDEAELLKLAKKFAETVEENTAVDREALTTFAQAIEGQELISQRMADHVANFDKTDEMSNQDKLAVFRKYSFIAREWGHVLDKFTEAMDESQIGRGKNILSDSIQNTRKNYEFIDNQIKKFYKNDGLVTVFREELEGNIYYQAAIKEQKERVAQLEKDYAQYKTREFGKKLEKEKELLRRYELTDETVAKYLSGEMGDTNPYSMYLESYTSNPDPIVGTFANWFMKHKFRAQARSQERLTKFENRISKLYKKLGITPKDFKETAQNLVEKQKYFTKMENGEALSREAWTFIHQYGNGWDVENNRLRELKEEGAKLMNSPLGSKEDYREKSRAFEQFKMDYMFDDTSDKVKEARLFWFRDNITHEAKLAQDEIFDQIRKNSFTDISKDESLEKAEENKNLWRQFRQLSSFVNPDGSPKTDEEVAIAKVIREYREKYGDLYEQVEIKGMFEANAIAYKNQVADELVATGKFASQEEAEKSPDYKKKVNEWYRDNIRILLTSNFYDERKKITDKINEITTKINDKEIQKQLDIGEKWNEILELVKGYRDMDNQPIGTDMSEDQLAVIKKHQQEIEDIKDRFNRMNDLTEEEADEWYELQQTMNMGLRLSPDDYARFKELNDKSKLKMSREDRAKLYAAFEELKALQSKISTPYYVDKVNDFLAKNGSELRITQFTSEDILNPQVINPILNQDDEFRRWWVRNHISIEKWDNSVQNVVTNYQRVYAWNRTVPNDNMFRTLLENGDYEGLANYKSQFVEIRKANEYYYRRLKPEYTFRKTKDLEWITHDNKGRWLPRPTRASATDAQRKYMDDNGIPYAKDDRFVNQRYLDLKNNKPELFELLEEYKKFHLESQEGLAKYARLGMEAPRLRKNVVETTSVRDMVDKPQEWWNNIKGWFGTLISKRNDDFELGTGNYNPAAQAQTYVLTDLMGDQINSIPIKYMTQLDPDEVSMDIGKAVSMYAVSAEVNKVLHEINPIANALKETLSSEENKPKDLAKKRRNIIRIVSDMFNRSADQYANKRGNYNRLKIIENFLEREMEGITNIQQFGPRGEKIVNFLMKIGAWGSLGLNVFAAVKNDISGRVQNNLEAVLGKNFTPSTLAKSNLEFGKLAQSLLNDYYSIGDKSLYTQLFLLFDPLDNFSQKAGTNFSKTAQRDALDLKFVMSLQKFGEINIQGSAWLAMMLHQKVKYTDSATQQETEIPYLKAWELNDGVLTLKEGVDPTWGKEGKNFLQFSAKVHKVNELNQGAYSEESQPEIHRMTLGKLFLFMRKFYVPGAVNRYSPKRFNSALGDFREGYWMPLANIVGTLGRNAAKGKFINPTGEEFKALFSSAERRAALRASSEIGFVLLCALLIEALGFDGDDEDRYKKLAENSWFHNFLIYQTMLVKSEAETFIPFYGMGVNESVRFLGTPSIAFNTARRWVKVGQDLLAWTAGEDRAYYQQDSGVYKEGQLKIFADLLNIIGWKNFAYLSSNEDLQQGLKIYASMQRRI